MTRTQRKGTAEKPVCYDLPEPLIVEGKSAETAILLLQSKETEPILRASLGLLKYAEKSEVNVNILIQLGIMKHVVPLLSHTEKVVKRNSGALLRELLTSFVARTALRSVDYLSSFYSLLDENDPVIHELASSCLCVMAMDHNSKDQLAQEDFMKRCISLLGANDPDVQNNSIEILKCILEDYEAKEIVRGLNIIRPLLIQSESEFLAIQRAALACLNKCMEDEELRLQMKQHNGMDHLIKMIKMKEYNMLHTDVAQVLANFLLSSECLHELVVSGKVFTILDLVVPNGNVNPDVKVKAMLVIARAMRNETTKMICHSKEFEVKLLALLTDGGVAIQPAVAEALAIMSGSRESRELICEHSGTEIFVKLLRSPDSCVRQFVTHALANLTLNERTIIGKVNELGGVVTLIDLVKDENQQTVNNSLTVLLNLTLEERVREYIIHEGLVALALEQITCGNSKVENSAVALLGSLLTDVESRCQFRDSNGVEVLLQLLQSADSEVRQNACWAISLAAADGNIAVDFVERGTLEILQDFCSLASRNDGFAQTAYNTLLNHNLSAKYCKTGSLSATDIIQPGFYDCGALPPEKTIPSLEHLTSENINDRRPVILVDMELQGDDFSDVPSSVHPNMLAGEHEVRHKKRRSHGLSRNKGQSAKDLHVHESTDSAEEIEQQTVKDPDLAEYLEDIARIKYSKPREQVEYIAKFVSDKLGGVVLPEKVGEIGFELPLMQLKRKLDSNIVPLGMIRCGTFFHRALLFKVLADFVDLPCSLTRGKYNRAWNEVMLVGSKLCDNVMGIKSDVYVVDLMHSPGKLLPRDSLEAANYKKYY